MARLNPDLELLETIVASHAEGIGRAALGHEFERTAGRAIPQRTLLRRLEALVAEGRVTVEGRGPATVYRSGPAPDAEILPTDVEGVPLSHQGARVRALVRRPQAARQPVTYDPRLLEGYKPGKTWYLPEQAREQLYQLGRTPDDERPAGTFARDILGRLLIDLSWASSRLEGNTYSRLDTQNLLEFGQRAEGKDATEAQMILNHKAAIELLVDGAEQVGFDRYTLLNLHAALSENLLSNPEDEGRLRRTPVMITGTPFVPLAIPQRIEELFDRFLATADAIRDPFEQSFFTMVHLPYLQPFIDINKRTSRLAANIPLIRSNLCPLSFVDVPVSVYVEATLGVHELQRLELLRDIYLFAYARSCAHYRVARDSIGQPDPLRLRYRSEFAEVVRATVLAGEAPRRDALRQWAQSHGIPSHDHEAFADTALGLLLGLHEHSAARYRIRPASYAAWRARYEAPGATHEPDR